MKRKAFLDQKDLLHPALAEEARQRELSSKEKQQKWLKVAVCFALFLIGMTMASCQHAPQEKKEGTLPKAETLPAVRIPWFKPSGMGFEGYLLKDIAELKNGNPWSESQEIEKLPVFQNKAFDSSRAGVPKGLNEAGMGMLLSQAASNLGLKVYSVENKFEPSLREGKTLDEQTPVRIIAQTDRGKIQVEANGELTYFPSEEEAKLPDSYKFSSKTASEEESEKVLGYFVDQYQSLLAFEQAQPAVPGTYDHSGNLNRDYYVYNLSEDKAEAILNYHFRRAEFFPDENGKLSKIKIRNALLVAEKIAEYPVISVEEATKRLKSGHYQSSAPALPESDIEIAKLELTYRIGPMEEVLLPYYRFYVLLSEQNLPEGAEKELKSYGGYYVPALPEEYIENMPLYEGKFN